jgi:hypothetical protein
MFVCTPARKCFHAFDEFDVVLLLNVAVRLVWADVAAQGNCAPMIDPPDTREHFDTSQEVLLGKSRQHANETACADPRPTATPAYIERSIDPLCVFAEIGAQRLACAAADASA